MNKIAFIPLALFTFIITSIFYTSPAQAETASLTKTFNNCEACGCDKRVNNFRKVHKPGN